MTTAWKALKRSLILSLDGLDAEQRRAVYEADDRAAFAIAMFTFVWCPVFYGAAVLFSFRSSQPEFVVAARSLATVGLLSQLAWLCFGRKPGGFGMRHFTTFVWLMQITHIMLLSYYAYASYLAFRGGLISQAVDINGGSYIPVEKAPLFFDLVVSHGYVALNVIAAAACTPFFGKKLLLNGLALTILVTVGFHNHKDGWMWTGIISTVAWAVLLSTGHRYTLKRREAILLLDNKRWTEKATRARVESELELARKIQVSLAPVERMRFKEHFLVHVLHQVNDPARRNWVATRTLGDGRLVVVIASPTSVGLDGALVAHSIQSLWAECYVEDEFAPDAWLSRLNTTICALGGVEAGVTASLGLMVLSDAEMHYYSAGHPPVLLVEAPQGGRETLRTVGKEGARLGQSRQASYEPVVLPLRGRGSFSLMLGSRDVVEELARDTARCVEVLDQLYEEKPEPLAFAAKDRSHSLVWIEHSVLELGEDDRRVS